MHVPSHSVFAHRLTSLGRTVFRHNRIEAICPEKPVPTASPTKLSPSVCTPRDKSWAHSFSAHSPWCNLSWKPVRPAMPSHYIASSKRSSPQAISHSVPSVPKLFPTVSRPSTLSSLPCRSFPSELSPLFPTVSFPSTFSLLPYWKPSFVQPSYFHPPYAALPQLFPRVGPTVFRNNRIHGICLPNRLAKTKICLIARFLKFEFVLDKLLLDRFV